MLVVAGFLSHLGRALAGLAIAYAIEPSSIQRHAESHRGRCLSRIPRKLCQAHCIDDTTNNNAQRNDCYQVFSPYFNATLLFIIS